MRDKVLCVIETNIIENIEWDEQILWMDINEINPRTYKISKNIIPVYNHPHSDKENGQKELHYHVDTRYTNSIFKIRIDLPLKSNQKLEYCYLKKIRDKELRITSTNLIKNSKLKHKCIHKGKCPHRGYDLSNEIPDENGIITCPLHGLKFDRNKKLINFEQ